MLGLTFLSQAYKQAKRHEKRFSTLRQENLQQYFDPKDLTDEQQGILQGLNAQLATSKHSDIACTDCEQACVLLRTQNIEVDYCLRCKGIWFDHNELKAFLQTTQDIPSDHLRHRQSAFTCPRCTCDMEEYVLFNPHNLLVDRCPQCLGVYLENNELERAFHISNK
ncbi:MAG: zf-TFIIB domain-containing protein [Planctomycetes bacterium]|nr:zf-TFIIB domain-containing protein [Planctomycetota bacterium]